MLRRIFQLFAVQQRGVAAQDERSAVEVLQGIGSLHYSVAGAKLLGLQGDGSLIAYHCFYQFCLMADDNNLLSAPAALAASITCCNMGLPPTLCSTLGYLLRILVPLPAARIIATNSDM